MAGEVCDAVVFRYVTIHPMHMWQIQQQATNQLREHFSQPAMEQPVRAKPAALRATNSTSTDRLDVDREEDEFGMGARL